MTVLSPMQLMDYARQAGFSGSGQAIIVAIAQAESGGNTQALNCNNPGGTCDRGVLQINNFFHPDVSDSCAYDPACAFQRAYQISNSGTVFSQWTTYTNGAYQKFLSGLPTGGTAGPSTPTTQTVPQTSSPLTSWISGMGPFFAWISNPLRVAKLIVGVILIGLSIYMLASPGGEAKLTGLMKGVSSNAQPTE
jgi:hypothetical protein